MKYPVREIIEKRIKSLNDWKHKLVVDIIKLENSINRKQNLVKDVEQEIKPLKAELEKLK